MLNQNAKTSDYFPWLLTLIALVIRMLYLSQIAAHNPYFNAETLVAEVHHHWAKAIISGTASAEPQSLIRAPLYPYLLAGIYGIFGADTLFPRLLQLLIGGFMTLGIFYAAKNMFDRKIAIAAAVIWAFYGPMIFFEGELFETSLTAALIFMAYFAWGKASEENCKKCLAAAGVLLGLAVLMKPNSAFFVPLLIVWYIVDNKKKLPGWKPILIFFAASVIIVIPVTIRNAIIGKEFVPVAAYGGLNFYIGNNPKADGVSAVIPGNIETEADHQWGKQRNTDALTAMSLRLASESAGKQLTPGEASGYWYRQTINFAVKQPGKFLLLNLKKIALFFNGFEYGNTRDLYFARQHSWLLSLLLWHKGVNFPLGLLIPFAGLGVFYTLKNKIPGARNLVVFLLGAIFSVTLVFVCARFRMTAIPFFIILAAAGIVQSFRGLTGKKMAVNLGILLPLFLLTNLNAFGLSQDTVYQEYYNLGRRSLEQGKFQDAYDNLNKSTNANPRYVPALNEMGVLLETFGKYPEAAYYYREAMKLSPGDAVAVYNLGAAEGKGGALDSAIVHLEQALELDSLFWQAWLNLGNCNFQLQDFPAAESCYRQAEELNPENPDILYNLGGYYLLQNQKARAKDYFLRVQLIDPEYPTIDTVLARAGQ